MNRNLSWLSTVLVLASFSFAEAQQSKSVSRIGYLAGTSQSAAQHNIEAFRQGLCSLGYLEGKNIVIEYRYAAGKLDRAESLVAELV